MDQPAESANIGEDDLITHWRADVLQVAGLSNGSG
jgi:hypothetical protein